jgi:cytoskeletal protein CcmA (bactofilin family)
MPWEWLQRKGEDPEEWTGFLEKGVRFTGNLSTTGTFRVNAIVQGDLVSDRTLILGEDADVEGRLEARVVIVGGKFRGQIRASERVEIQTGATVAAEVDSPSLLIGAGAVFEGSCRMVANAPDSRPVTILIRPSVRPVA